MKRFSFLCGSWIFSKYQCWPKTLSKFLALCVWVWHPWRVWRFSLCYVCKKTRRSVYWSRLARGQSWARCPTARQQTSQGEQISWLAGPPLIRKTAAWCGGWRKSEEELWVSFHAPHPAFVTPKKKRCRFFRRVVENHQPPYIAGRETKQAFCATQRFKIAYWAPTHPPRLHSAGRACFTSK